MTESKGRLALTCSQGKLQSEVQGPGAHISTATGLYSKSIPSMIHLLISSTCPQCQVLYLEFAMPVANCYDGLPAAATHPQRFSDEFQSLRARFENIGRLFWLSAGLVSGEPDRLWRYGQGNKQEETRKPGCALRSRLLTTCECWPDSMVILERLPSTSRDLLRSVQARDLSRKGTVTRYPNIATFAVFVGAVCRALQQCLCFFT